MVSSFRSSALLPCLSSLSNEKTSHRGSEGRPPRRENCKQVLRLETALVTIPWHNVACSPQCANKRIYSVR